MEDHYHVFVLKLWCEPREAEDCLWRGSIENAMTRRVVYFNDLGELNAFLQGSVLGQPPASDPQRPPRKHRSTL